MGGLLSVVEGGVFIIAGCLATMRTLLSSRMLTSHQSSNGMDLKDWPAFPERNRNGSIFVERGRTVSIAVESGRTGSMTKSVEFPEPAVTDGAGPRRREQFK
jgi:hypothetical protein